MGARYLDAIQTYAREVVERSRLHSNPDWIGEYVESSEQLGIVNLLSELHQRTEYEVAHDTKTYIRIYAELRVKE